MSSHDIKYNNNLNNKPNNDWKVLSCKTFDCSVGTDFEHKRYNWMGLHIIFVAAVNTNYTPELAQQYMKL